MWRRPRLVTADTKSPAPQPARRAGGVEPSRRTRQRGRRRDLGRQRHGGAPWGGPPGCAGGLMPRKRGVARYCATRIKAGRLWALRQSPRSGVGSAEGEKRKKNPDANEPGKKKLGCLTL